MCSFWLIQDASLMSWLSRVSGRQNRRHGRKIFIEIGVCHTNWISIMVVFGLIDLLINQRSGYFENFPPWDARQYRVVLCRRASPQKLEWQTTALVVMDPRCCTTVNARGISIHSALPAWWEEKSAVVWWFVIAGVLIINGTSIIPTFATASTLSWQLHNKSLSTSLLVSTSKPIFSLSPAFDSAFNFLTLPDLFYGHDKVNFMIRISNSMTPTTRAMNQWNIRSSKKQQSEKVERKGGEKKDS